MSQVMVVPVVIGALGVTSKRLKDWLEKLNIKSSKSRTLAKSSIAWNYRNCKASPRNLRLLGATWSLGNIPKLPTKLR